jgi:hypothetical protein
MKTSEVERRGTNVESHGYEASAEPEASMMRSRGVCIAVNDRLESG